MEGNDSFHSCADSFTSSSSDLSSPSPTHSYAASFQRPLCEYEEFCSPSWRSVSSWASIESGSLSRSSHRSAPDVDAHWEELPELLEIRQEIANQLSLPGLNADQIRMAQYWLHEADDKIGIANKLRKRSNVSLLFSWSHDKDVLKLKESIAALGRIGKGLIDALNDTIISYEHTLSQIGRYIAGEEIHNVIGIKGNTEIFREFLKQESSHQFHFDGVICLTMTYGTPTSGVQYDIAQQLSISLWKYQTQKQRRTVLFNVLSSMKFLLLLDDLQSLLNLEEIGIPRPTSGNMSKIVITSRSEEVCKDMGADVVIDAPMLPE